MTQFKQGDTVTLTVTYEITALVDRNGEVYDHVSDAIVDVNDPPENIVVKKFRKPAADYLIGSVVKTVPYIPFVKVTNALWVGVGGSGRTLSNTEMDEMHLSDTTVFCGIIDDDGRFIDEW